MGKIKVSDVKGKRIKYLQDDPIPDLDAAWQVDEETAYPGKRVEEFIKRQFGTKVGYVYRTPEKQDDGNYHLQFFATEEAYNTWAADKDAHSELLLGDVALPEGGGGQMTASYYDGLYTNTSTTGYVTTDGTFKVEIRFTSQLHNPVNNTDEDTGNSGVLVIQRRASDTESWQTVGKQSISSTPASETTTWQTIDLSKYLLDGSQNIRLQVVDDAAGVKTRYIVYNNVVKTNLGLTFATEWEEPITDGVIPLAFYIQGSVNKTLHVRISGDGGIRELSYDTIGTNTYTETPWTQNVSDATTDAVKVTSHGVHDIEAWLTVGTGTESEHVHAQVFVRKDATDIKTYMVVNNILTKAANYTDAKFFEYAVITANGATANVHVKIADSTGKTLYGETVLANRESGKKYEYNGMLEIESEAKTLSAYFNFTDDAGEKIADRIAIAVDNSQNFAPTVGASFILNPKNRSNEETEAKSIVNGADGSVVKSTWKGFAMSDADGWNDNALVVPAGHEVDIDYETYSDFLGSGNHTASLTVELDLKIDHVSGDDPVVRLCSFLQDGKTPVGLLFKGLQAEFMTVGKKDEGSQNVMLQEGVRTHVALNIVYNLGQSGVNYVRIFVNGKINREFSYSADDAFVQYVTEDGETKQTSQGIRLGGSGADLTLYGMRIYKKALSSADVRQDSMSALPSAAAKVAFRDANAITGDNGLINYTKAREKYNTLLHTGPLPSYSNKNEYDSGVSLDIHIVGDPKHSGVMNNLSVKGQGSSSKGYWKWNQQYKGNADTRVVSEDGQTTIKKGYQLDDSVPVAKKLVGKLNWASSMQSHKEGGTNMYNDLWKEVVGGNSITKTAGYENCRVAVKEKPFLFFHRETENDEPVFDGMMTFGPGKADKPTFWGDEDKFPDLLMIEGSDNGRPLTLCQVPWMDDEVTSSEDGWSYAGNISWDNDMGNLDSLHYFKDAFNQVFLHSIAVKPHEGGLSALKADNSLDKAVQYWITEDEGENKQYDLFRFDYVTNDWVNASASKTNGIYDRLNINEQCGNVASGVDWEASNEKFIAKRVEWARSADGLSKYFNIDDTLFENDCCKLMAASDNRCKNIYCYVDPVTHLICWYQDDVDTIGPIDNVGQNRKKYFLEEHDSEANGVLKAGEAGWNGDDNNLFNLLEAAYRTEVREMMMKILTAMAALCGSPEAFVQKYFFDVSEYFPAVAYNETARVLYEEAASAMSAGRYSNATDPLSQSLGDNLECEKEWWKWRLIYMASYCNYGQFTERGDKSLFFRSVINTNGNDKPDYTFRLVPAKWLYISGYQGQALKFGTGNDQPQRAQPGKVFTLDGMSGDKNTDIGICGADYFESFGNFGGVSLGETFNLTGERLTEFVATSDGDMQFRPTEIKVNNCPMLKKFVVNKASALSGTMTLSTCMRLESVDTMGTGFTSVLLPPSPVLTTVKLGSSTHTIILDGASLNSVTLESYAHLQSVEFARSLNKNFDVLGFLEVLRTNKASLGSLIVHDVNWNSLTLSQLDYILSVTTPKVDGVITMKAGSTIDFDTKLKMVSKWGDVDDKNNSLYVSYKQVALQSISISGMSVCMSAGTYQFSLKPSPETANDFKKIEWSIVQNPYATINDNGLLTVTSVGTETDAPSATVTLKVTRVTGDVVSDSLNVGFYYRTVRPGDYVFNDGSYGSGLINGKTPIGICFWVNPDNPEDRRMMSLLNQSDYDQWGVREDDNVKFTEADGTEFRVADTYGENGTNDKEMYLTTVERTFGPWKAGDSVPYGMRQTLLILEYRNRVLKDAGFDIPAASTSQTEIQSLRDCFNTHQNYKLYYYPAVSYCYAFEPAADNLDERFKANHWYLPTIKELIEMYKTSKLESFNKAVTNGVAKNIGTGVLWSSIEGSGYDAWTVRFSDGYVGSDRKGYMGAVRAVAAF